MRFQMSVKEAQYIQKKFKFSPLLGLDRVMFAPMGVEKKLINAGVIQLGSSGGKELDTKYRYLFSAWEKMRYSVVDPNENDGKSFFCVLANEKEIILLEQVDQNLTLELIDFKTETMDRILANMTRLNLDIQCGAIPFNIVLPVKDFTDFVMCRQKGTLSKWSNALGVSELEIDDYLEQINNEESFVMLLCEDHVLGVGMLIKVVCARDVVYALKHVTPENASEEKMVLLKGDARSIVDSVYVF